MEKELRILARKRSQSRASDETKKAEGVNSGEIEGDVEIGARGKFTQMGVNCHLLLARSAEIQDTLTRQPSNSTSRTLYCDSTWTDTRSIGKSVQ